MIDGNPKEDGHEAAGVVVYQPQRHITMKRVTESEWESARMIGVRTSIMIAGASSFLTAFLAILFEALRTESAELRIVSGVVLTMVALCVAMVWLDVRAWKRISDIVDKRNGA